MKYSKLLFFFSVSIVFSSCDPVSNLEANIENLTSQTLYIDFIASDVSVSKTLQLAPNQTMLFQEGFDIGSTFLEPSLEAYDSVVIKNLAEDILKVFKPNDAGKNIYNVDDWIDSEPSRRFFKYEYEIVNEDID